MEESGGWSYSYLHLIIWKQQTSCTFNQHFVSSMKLEDNKTNSQKFIGIPLLIILWNSWQWLKPNAAQNLLIINLKCSINKQLPLILCWSLQTALGVLGYMAGSCVAPPGVARLAVWQEGASGAKSWSVDNILQSLGLLILSAPFWFRIVCKMAPKTCCKYCHMLLIPAKSEIKYAVDKKFIN